jgi:hypothetical protein
VLNACDGVKVLQNNRSDVMSYEQCRRGMTKENAPHLGEWKRS